MASIRRGQQDLDDDSLRKRLLGYGEAVGPITDTTRASYQRRLSRLQNGTKSSARNRSSPSPADYQSLAGLSSDDSDYDSGGSLRSSRRKSAVPARKKATVTTPERTRRSLPAAPLTRPGLRSRAVNTSLYSDDFSETDNDVTPSHYQLQQTPLLTPRSTFNSGSLLVHKSDEGSRGNGYTAQAEQRPRYQWVPLGILVGTALFFVCLAAAYRGMSYPSSQPVAGQPPADAKTPGPPRTNAPFNVTLCENNREKPCIYEADVPAALELAGRTQKLLGQIAGDYECGQAPFRSLKSDACLEFLRASSEAPITDATFSDTLLLLFENPAWGIKLLTPAAEPVRSYVVEAVAALEANQAVKSFWCCLRLAVHGFLHVILMTAFVLVVFVVLYVCVVRYKAWKDRRQQQVYTLAEQITAMVKEHAEQPNCKEPFLAQAHVRDMLISPAQRKQLSGVWQAAVAYLERHETQLRAELQQVEGESWMVWRWLGPVSTPRAKVWQGRAFENSQGGASTGAGSSPSVGGLSTYVPATCLKIRNMFDPEVEYESGWARQIENAILEKCEGNTGIVHIHVDTASREGCVYVKCASLDSAGQAYRALHGSWFDGNLITVKYLRLERYHDRFPEARFCHTPMRPSNSLRLSLDRGPSSNPPEDDTL